MVLRTKIMSQDPQYVRVFEIKPFWRYAVGPASEQCPAIPFYTEKGARAFFGEAMRDLPFCGTILYRRRWFSRTIGVEQQYTPPKS